MNAASPDQADVKVSVAMITYNHEAFIAQAINSVLMQQVNFNYELVIGEDCSTDNTRSIVTDFRDRHPDKIRLVVSNVNVGANKNEARTLQACRGQYIAFLEGDDYWTDPAKLQKQVDFLESQPGCALCFHDVMMISEDGACVAESYSPPNRKPIYTLDDILERCFIQSCSVMLRNGLVLEYPNQFKNVLNGDWVLFILNAQHGDIGYLDERMAAYRLHPGGVWTSRGRVNKLEQILPLYGLFYNYLGESHGAAVRAGACTTIATCAAALYDASETDSLSSSLAFVRTALASAVEAGYYDPAFERTTQASSYESLGFTAYKKQDMRTVRYCFARALALSPSLARNTGIWSILFEAIFGKSASDLRKAIVSRLHAGGSTPVA
jgi:glycosyltransferase involved in cell wall biosynthesis